MRREFELTEAEEKELLEAMGPVPYMVVGGIEPEPPQVRANRAWEALGRKRGFKGMTVEPAPGKGQRFFTAEVTEGCPPGCEVRRG